MDNHRSIHMVMRASAALGGILALAVLISGLFLGLPFLPAAGLAVFAWVGALLCFIALGRA